MEQQNQNQQQEQLQNLSPQEQEAVNEVNKQEAKIEQELKGDTELFAGKFKSVEELEKSYKALESRLGQPKKDSTPTQEEVEKTEDNIEEALNNSSLDIEAIEKEYEQNNQLSEATYETLKKAGLSKELVDGYIKGQEALIQQQVNEIYSITGGEENYQDMLTWASNNLPKETLEQIQTSLNTQLGKTAIAGLYAQYTNAVGKDPNLFKGNSNSNTDEVFTSQQQIIEAMSNPKYEKDSAYRAKVMSKVMKSNI